MNNINVGRINGNALCGLCEKVCIRVDKVLDGRPMASTRAGGYGLRYTCRIGGQLTFLYYEPENRRWFVEEKEE